MRHGTWSVALLLSGCGQGDYTFSVEQDVGQVTETTATDSAPIVWEDCGIAGELADTVTIDHSCLDGADLQPDLKITITDVCFPSCEEGAPVFIAVQLTNQGGQDVSGNIPVAVYAGSAAAGSGDVPVHVYTHSGGLAAGERAAGAVLEFDVSALGGQPVRVEVNDDGTGEALAAECDETNNRAVWDAVPCNSE